MGGIGGELFCVLFVRESASDENMSAPSRQKNLSTPYKNNPGHASGQLHGNVDPRQFV